MGKDDDGHDGGGGGFAEIVNTLTDGISILFQTYGCYHKNTF